jgi:TRAP-type uncharacterized transport system fused permease subunit
VPALFHYFACLTMVHLEAKRLKLGAAPKISRVVATSWHLVFPLIALVTICCSTSRRSCPFWGIVLCIASYP